MHIETNDPIAALRRLQALRASGQIDQSTFDAAYAELDRSTAAALCDNGDNRIAVQIDRGRRLCGVCALMARAQRRRGW